MLRKQKWQIPGEPLLARFNWCQGPTPSRDPAVEKHWITGRNSCVSASAGDVGGHVQLLNLPRKFWGIISVEYSQRESCCVTFLHTTKWHMAFVCGQTAQPLNLVLISKSPEVLGTKEPMILPPQGLSRHHSTHSTHKLCRYTASG